MRLIILLLLLPFVYPYPSKLCLETPSYCNEADFSVAEYDLCGGPFPVDPISLPEKGTGFKRKPEQCPGYGATCVFVMNKDDLEKLKCQETNLSVGGPQNCTNFKEAKKCSEDFTSLIAIIVGALVLGGCLFLCYTQEKIAGKLPAI
tara:strand:- start:580 stop:1020 length:441 start_codon:yes stop_codon:yes gene_type:complete